MDLRQRGARREGRIRGRDDRSDPLEAIDAGSPGEVRINGDTMQAIDQLFHTSPSVRAACAILHGQLVGSGIVVRRGGQDVVLQEAFAKHLEDVWVPFARRVIDSFLKWGFCVVSIENEAPKPFAGLRAARKRDRAMQERDDLYRSDERGDAAIARQRGLRQAGLTSGGKAVAKRPARGDEIVARGVYNLDTSDPRDVGQNMVPLVPELNTYMISYIRRPDSNYARDYRIFTTSSRNVFRRDYAAEIFFREEPDSAGNICSPLATVFQSASFISALEELALQAEVVRARQLLVTQPAQKATPNANLDPANLFFDSESRAIQSQASAEEDSSAVESLSLSVRLCEILNKIQTTNQGGGNSGGRGAGAGAASSVPPELPPRMFAVPDKQSVVPGVRPPEARSDLVELMRVVNDHIAASLGVPASVIFEGKFSSNSMSQLQLLNTTVTSLSLAVNRVLTAAFHACFENAPEGTECCLITAPLSSTEEIAALYTNQVIDIESALPAALHSLGCTAEEIAGALARRKQAEDTRLGSEAALAASQSEVQAADAAVKRETVGLVKSQVEKTKAEAQKARHDASAPYPSATPAPGGSSSGTGSKK